MRRQFSFIQLAIIVISILAALLLGCETEVVDLEPPQAQDPFQVTMTLPYKDQPDVCLSSLLLIHFSEGISPISVSDKIHIVDEDGEMAGFVAEVQDTSIVIEPGDLWEPLTTYTVTIDPGIRSITGRVTQSSHIIDFTTGVRRPNSKQRLQVTRILPDPDDPCWDFMTFRVFFNEPVDRQSLNYGQSVRMTDLDTGTLVPGNLFGRSNQIVFDPDEDLTPDHTYRLTVTTHVRDYPKTAGEITADSGLEEDYIVDFKAVSTGTKTKLAMDKCPTVVEGLTFCDALPDNNLFPQSSFIKNVPGKSAKIFQNSMYTDSVLLGPTSIKVGSRLWNEFGEGKLSPDRIPFVVRKGQMLYGKGLKGAVGGVISSGVDTGMVRVHVLTDAIGELSGSEFVHGVSGLPATITLTMDAAVDTEDATSNAILGQPILGVTLVGQAKVSVNEQIPDYEELEIELVAFAEIELVGEYVPVTMALKMVPPPEVPEEEFDEDPPTVCAISPIDFKVSPENIEDDVIYRLAGDEIIITMSEPVDPNQIREKIYLLGPNGKVSGQYDIYPPKIAFRPATVLDPSTEYTVVVEKGLKDLSGNETQSRSEYKYTTLSRQSSTTEPPILAATVPGRYDGAFLASNFFAEMYFTQNMDPKSLVSGETFYLFDANNQLVSGTTMWQSSLIGQFLPNEKLIPGQEYRLVITDGITNVDGVALDTDVDRTPGGPDIIVPFIAVAPTKYIQSMFITYPYVDTNVDGFFEPGIGEKEVTTNYMEMDFPLIHELSYLMGYFPIRIESLVETAEGPRLPVIIEPSATLYATSVTMSLGGGAKDDLGLLELGRSSIEMLDPSSTDLIQGADNLIDVDADTTMNFELENTLLNNIVLHDTYFKIPSKLRFTQDGRMVVLIEGGTSITMDIPIIGLVEIPIWTKMCTSTMPSRRGF